MRSTPTLSALATVSLLAVAFLAFSAAPLLAQENSSNAGTSQEGRGSTGWTGGARESDKGGATTGAANSTTGDAAARGQPAMASGLDLKGPSVRFAPAKTPE